MRGLTMVDEVPLVSQLEVQRKALDKAVTTCLRAWPFARLDTEALGFPSSGGDSTVGRGTCTDGGPTARLGTLWAERPDPSVRWLVDLFDVIDGFAGGASWVGYTEVRIGVRWHVWADDYANRFPAGRRARREWMVLADKLYALADSGRAHWLDVLVSGRVVGGVTVGERGNSSTLCDLCGEPIAGSHADPVRKVPDGQGGHKNLHRSPCWYTWATDQGVHPRQLRSVPKGE